MSRSATVRARPRRAAAVQQATPTDAVRSLGQQVETEFREAAAQAVQQAHAARVPVAILTEDNQIVWLHPDGIVRPTR